MRYRGSKRSKGFDSTLFSTNTRFVSSCFASDSDAWRMLGSVDERMADRSAADNATTFLSCCWSLIAAPMQRFAWPTRFALRTTVITSWRMRSSLDSLRYGLSRRRSSAPRDESSAPKRNSTQLYTEQ